MDEDKQLDWPKELVFLDMRLYLNNKEYQKIWVFLGVPFFNVTYKNILFWPF